MSKIHCHDIGVVPMTCTCPDPDSEYPVEAPSHYHRVGKVLVACYHKCRHWGLTQPSFWIAMTLTFPLEHALWTKVWPFKLLAGFMGL